MIPVTKVADQLTIQSFLLSVHPHVTGDQSHTHLILCGCSSRSADVKQTGGNHVFMDLCTMTYIGSVTPAIHWWSLQVRIAALRLDRVPVNEILWLTKISPELTSLQSSLTIHRLMPVHWQSVARQAYLSPLRLVGYLLLPHTTSLWLLSASGFEVTLKALKVFGSCVIDLDINIFISQWVRIA